MTIDNFSPSSQPPLAPQGQGQRPSQLIPATAEGLLTLAEERREAILASVRKGEQGVSVRESKTFARFLRGELPGMFPLPNLERLWNAAYALGLADVPPWPGEPADSPSALERLGELIGWLQGKRSESDKPAEQSRETAVREYLVSNPRAPIRLVKEAIGVSIGAVHKTAAWQAEMKRRASARPAIRQKPFPLLANRGIVNADEQLCSREPSPPDAAIAAEESTGERIWDRLVEKAKPHERAALDAASPEIRQQLIQAVSEGRSGDDLQLIVALFASQRQDVESEEWRNKRSRRSGKQA